MYNLQGQADTKNKSDNGENIVLGRSWFQDPSTLLKANFKIFKISYKSN